MWLPRRRIFVIAVVSYCIGCILLQIWVDSRFDLKIHDSTYVNKLPSSGGRRLGVIVPIHSREMAGAMEKLRHWSAKCSESIANNIDLVLYSTKAFPNDLEFTLKQVEDATPCFGTPKMVSANLPQQENRHPMAKSFQFYKLFLDPEVRAQVADYDALALVDWNMVVAHDRSFEELYAHAFSSSDTFWVKGSRLAGSQFHDIAALSEMWHILGHLNGNAIYDNTDPFFVEYVNFTRSRWGLAYAYDVALWTTMSDYPYSWPLWQRYSSKFVATSIVSTIGSLDKDKAVMDASGSGTLFFHERVEEVVPQPQVEGCEKACGASHDLEAGLSSVCDPACLSGETLAGSRFNGDGCGAGDPAKYGETCRLCFEDQKAALAADKGLAEEGTEPSAPRKHVIMCETKRPPEAIDCPYECSHNINTVCDDRCGSGRYSDWQCNWRRMGDKCRFCFRDIAAARLADEIARKRGGRVIMCDTHEPPPVEGAGDNAVGEYLAGRRNLADAARDPISMEVKDSSLASTADSSSPEEPASPVDPPALQFPNMSREQICVFLPGFFEFFHETNATIASIRKFMPGVRVTIATHPTDFHVFSRTLAEEAMVSVVNSSHPGYAALAADISCGEETKVIYYMNPGELLSRAFTAKDTHSPRGDLLVKYTDVELVDGENVRRSMASTALLGVQSLSFTHGSDLILPAKANAQLRVALQDASKRFGVEEWVTETTYEDVDMNLMYRALDLFGSQYFGEISVYIPELLAAILFSQKAVGVQFVNPKQWRSHPPFPEISIWDVPLVKPRLGCAVDLSPSLKGYDIATHLTRYIDVLANGARCDRGFVTLDPTAFKLKPEWEFPSDRSGWVMPSLRDYRVSVMYRSFLGDVDLFKISFPTVIKNIPDAFEVVVVVEEADEKIFEELIAPYRESTPFPLRVVTEPSLMDGHIQHKYSKIRADLYTEGDYILHLDSDVVVFEEITYEHIFHLGKPVLPYRRYREDSPEGSGLASCWRNGTSQAIGEDVVHEFSIFNTHVYPRQMYPALRKFIEDRHEKSLPDFMSGRRGKCWSPKILSKWTHEERLSLLSDFNLMGAFLWYHMRDAVYWIATDPLDLQPDQWRPDLSQYAWTCEANARTFPKDEKSRAQYQADILSIRSTDQCKSVLQYWRRRSRMKEPESLARVPRPMED